jgi:hypothetical protein
MGIAYTTREDVMSAQDIKATAYAGRDIDRAVDAGARAAEGLLHRVFYPWTGTHYFDYPGDMYARAWRIWLGRFDLISATSVVNGDGSTVATGNLFLEPQDGPPYDHVEINRGTTSSFASGATMQRAVAITGVWGWSTDEELAGTAAEALDASETGIDGSGMPTVGVGSVIRVDSERMVVTDKTWLSTGQTGSLAVQQNAQTLTVADGTAFVSGEVLLLDAERVKVVDIAGNNLTVRRAVDGTTLAAHTTATIYALRVLTVQRGALGTTAATHLINAPVYRWLPPALLAELNLAYAINNLLQRQSGYARTVGTGDTEREMFGRAIRRLEDDAKAVLGRRARTAAV